MSYSNIAKWVMLYRIMLFPSLAIVTSMNCFEVPKDIFCESKRDILMKEGARAYMHKWINANLIGSGNLDDNIFESGMLGKYRSFDKFDFDWDLIRIDIANAEIDVFGDNLDNIEVVSFGEGMRRGILISLREDKQIPIRWFNRKDICYQSGEFAVYNSDIH